MIKMFIANEEVVSNQQFTINEEMLSASSTILNNCYPKSWELTKDYTNNFYYPKDYSKFVLADGEYLYGNDEFTVLEANSMQFETNVDKELADLNIYGNTEQYVGLGKNLIYLQDINIISHDVTIKKVSNSSIAFNGTATATFQFTLNLYKTVNLEDFPII